jgi:type I restriction enzyme M protein
MEPTQLNWITNFIWGIADDVLRDLYVRGKYRDVILPMTVLRRLDAVLEPTKPAALALKADEEPLAELAERLARRLGPRPHTDYNAFTAYAEDDPGRHGFKLTPKRRRLLRDGLTRRDENASPVKTKRGEVEPDPELRDTEQIPLLEPGGIAGFIGREVLPYAPDAWVDRDATKIGYEIGFNRYFYKPQPMRSLEEIRADILALERETDGLLDEILGGTL